MGIIIGIVIAVLFFGVVAYFIATHNSFVRLKNKLAEAFSGMDVFLKKRYDMIPNLVNTVKGYASHEKETLQGVIEARNMAAGSVTVEDKIANENILQGTLKSLFAVAESYPELKADTQFINLQREISTIEEEISRSRRYYNAVVKEFNDKCGVFPSNLVAKMFNFKTAKMFEIAEVERDNVKVEF